MANLNCSAALKNEGRKLKAALNKMEDCDLILAHNDILHAIDNIRALISCERFSDIMAEDEMYDYLDLAYEYFEEYGRSYFESPSQAKRSRVMALRNVSKALELAKNTKKEDFENDEELMSFC